MARSDTVGRMAPLLAPFLILLGACGGGELEGAALWGGTVDTLPGGTLHVFNPETGVWDSASTWRIEEELRIGSLDGDGPDVLGQVRAVLVDGAGRIYALETQAQEIRVFDHDGSHVRTFGRRGSGPGEIRNGAGMAWDTMGRLWISDPQNGRLSAFDTSGQYVGAVRRPGGFMMFPWPGGFDADGNLWDVGFAGEKGEFRPVLSRIDTMSESADTIEIPRFGNGERFELRSRDGGVMMASVPFTAGMVWAFDPRGFIWFGLSNRYRIYQTTFAGDTLRIIDRVYAPVAITDDELAKAIDGLEWFTRQGGKIDPTRIPTEKPSFRRMTIDPHGNIWVLPHLSRDVVPQGRAAFDVFDDEGRYLGRVTSDVRFDQMMIFRGDYVYGVTRDEFDVPYLVRARVVKPATQQ